MRVAIDTQSTIGRKTGIGYCAIETLSALRISYPEHQFIDLNLGRPILMRLHERLCWQQWLVPRKARKIEATLLHVPGFDAPVLRSLPTILTVHDLIGVLFKKNFPPISRFYWSTWLPFTIRFADLIIADSDATRRDITRLTNVSDERIRVVPLGVDRRFSPASQAQIQTCKKQLDLPDKFILYLGTLEPRKGVDTLIDAFSTSMLDEDVWLVLAGKQAWFWDKIQNRLDASPRSNRIKILGYIPDEFLPALYSAARVFVFPSRYEGFGLPVLEAMACGTPVICSNAASLPEVAGDAAVQISPDDVRGLADAITATVSNDQFAANLSAKGLSQAGKFTWKNTARGVMAAYKEVVK
ncbi:MAG TPA: glycosyltransferase family 1 protein [Thermoflexales bacterium]|nr:glycosyltransferase family 1 protein [Thermoflexales bacterium]